MMHCRSMTQETLRHHAARALRILETYWHGLAVGGGVPHWSAIDPGAIQDALEYAFLADRLGRAHARLRVAGGSVTGLFGGELTGMPLSTLLNPTSRKEFDAALAGCFKRRSGLDLMLCTSGKGGRPLVAARMVLYPLRDDQGRVTQILGGLAPTDDTGPAPCRFDLTGICEIETTARRAFRPLPAKGHLRLVVSNP